MRTDKFNIWLKKRMGERPKRMLVSLLHRQRNSFILFNYSNKAKKNRVNLDYWCESFNLGDTLAPVVVNHLLAMRGIDPNKKVSKRKHLYALGSILTAGIQDCTVWGSGVLNTRISYRLRGRKFDIRAVRGPMTKMVMEDYGYECPEVYGDPAIFMPDIYQPRNLGRRWKCGVVIHMFQKGEINVPEDDIVNIDIETDDYKDFINKLCSVDLVISSSLHGIILAESYGVRAILLKPKVDMLKYFDWYFSTGRYTFPIADTIDEAYSMTPAPLPDLSRLKEGLLKAFPYDLYEC